MIKTAQSFIERKSDDIGVVNRVSVWNLSPEFDQEYIYLIPSLFVYFFSILLDCFSVFLNSDYDSPFPFVQ